MFIWPENGPGTATPAVNAPFEYEHLLINGKLLHWTLKSCVYNADAGHKIRAELPFASEVSYKEIFCYIEAQYVMSGLPATAPGVSGWTNPFNWSVLTANGSYDKSNLTPYGI